MLSVHIEISGSRDVSVEIDGQDIAPAVTGIHVDKLAREFGPAKVGLELAFAYGKVVVDGVPNLIMTEHTRRALVLMGWIPPAGES